MTDNPPFLSLIWVRSQPVFVSQIPAVNPAVIIVGSSTSQKHLMTITVPCWYWWQCNCPLNPCNGSTVLCCVSLVYNPCSCEYSFLIAHWKLIQLETQLYISAWEQAEANQFLRQISSWMNNCGNSMRWIKLHHCPEISSLLVFERHIRYRPKGLANCQTIFLPMLCCAILRYAMLCCTNLRYTMLYYHDQEDAQNIAETSSAL